MGSTMRGIGTISRVMGGSCRRIRIRRVVPHRFRRAGIASGTRSATRQMGDPTGLQVQAPWSQYTPGYCPAQYGYGDCLAMGYFSGTGPGQPGEPGGGGNYNPCASYGVGFQWVPTMGCMPYVAAPSPPPAPAPPKTACSIKVAFSGTPKDGQNLVGLTPYSPLKNQLGPYNTLTRALGPRLRGWFFAVQIQGQLSGDMAASNWTILQTSSTSGSVQLQPLGGQPMWKSIEASSHDDSPTMGVYRGTGAIDWLDELGFSQYQGSAIVVRADATFRFTSVLMNSASRASCSVSWSLRFVGSGSGIGVTR